MSRAAPALLLVIFAGSILHGQTPASQTPAKPRLDSLGDPLPDGAIARLGTLRFKHSPSNDPTVDIVRYSPDGTKIVSLVFGQQSIRVFEADTGKEIKGPWTKQNQITAVAFSPDSKTLAVAGQPGGGGGKKKADKSPPGSLYLYTIGSKDDAKTLPGPQKSVQALMFADDAKTLIAAGSGSVSWWEIATGKELRNWQPFKDEPQRFEGLVKLAKTFNWCVIAPDAKTIAIHVVWLPEEGNRGGPGQNRNNLDHEAIGYELSTGKRLWRVAGGAYNQNQNPNAPRCGLAFAADSRRVAIAMDPSNVQVRDTATGKLVVAPRPFRIEGEKVLGGLALSSDGSQFAMAGDEGHVHIWKVGTQEPERKFVARIAQFWGTCTNAVDFAPDDKTLLVGVDADLQQYDMASLKELHASEGHRGWIDYVAFSADGRRLVTGSADINMHPQEIVAWDTATWKSVQQTSLRHPLWPNMGIVSYDQNVFIGKNGNDRFSLFDLQSGTLRSRMVSPAKSNNAGRGFFSPDGDFYIFAGNRENDEEGERLYSVATGKLLCRLPALGMSDRSMDSTQPIAFSADKQWLALAARKDGKIHIVEIATGKTSHVLGPGFPKEGPMGPGGGFNGREGVLANLAFSLDGRYLASWLQPESVVHVWDVATGKELWTVVPGIPTVKGNRDPDEGNGGNLHFAWSPDSRVLAVGDNKIGLWELASLRKRRDLPGHGTGPVRAFSYSPTGQVLASGSSDTTVLIWDMTTAGPPLSDSLASTPEAIQKRWDALAGDDANKAFAAILELAATPKETIAWLQDHVKPATPIDPKIVTELIAQLDDEQFKVRQKANSELLKIGERAVPIIDKALEAKPSLETQTRLQNLRKGATGLVFKGEGLRTVRVLETLERIGTTEAHAIIETLARGADGATATTQAKMVLTRWR